MNPLVSIIVPTFNRGYILPNTVLSVLEQSYTNWELVIVDDGSSDNTPKYLESLKTNKRIKYLMQKNQGLASARNNGMIMARGDWICYLDSDNELFSNCLEVMVKKIEANPNIIFAIPKSHRTLEQFNSGKLIKIIDNSSDFPDQISTIDIFHRKFHCDENGLIHTKKIIQEGFRWDKKAGGLLGWDFVMQIATKYPSRFLYISKTLLNYHQRFGGDGMTSNTNYLDWANWFEYVFQKHKDCNILKGQQWYPQRVEFYKKLHVDYKNGKIPSFQDKFFI